MCSPSCCTVSASCCESSVARASRVWNAVMSTGMLVGDAGAVPEEDEDADVAGSTFLVDDGAEFIVMSYKRKKRERSGFKLWTVLGTRRLLRRSSKCKLLLVAYKLDSALSRSFLHSSTLFPFHPNVTASGQRLSTSAFKKCMQSNSFLPMILYTSLSLSFASFLFWHYADTHVQRWLYISHSDRLYRNVEYMGYPRQFFPSCSVCL